MHGFVAAAVDAFMAGYTFDKVNLQIAVSGQSVELEAKPSLERLVRASVQSRELDRHDFTPSRIAASHTRRCSGELEVQHFICCFKLNLFCFVLF